jgi:hypothetical protein
LRPVRTTTSGPPPARTSQTYPARPSPATRFIAEKGDNQECHVVGALSLRELLNRLEEIVAAE